MEQESTDEFGCLQCHHRGLIPVSIVLPAKGYRSVLKGNQAPVGDGHAVGVACQVLQDLLRSSKRRFSVDHPLASHNLVQPAEKISVLRKRLHLAMEAELRLMKGSLQEVDELGTEEPT